MVRKVTMSKRLVVLLIGGILAAGVWSCDRAREDRTPKWLQEKYGLTEAYADSVRTPDGAVQATIVPVTLEDGRQAQLIVPQKRSEYPIYLRDAEGVKPVLISDQSTSRDQFVRSRPVMVERQAAPRRVVRKRSLKKEILIVGGGAAAGAAIGGIAGGGKGAGIGALSGGIAGLVYDLATRRKG